MFKFIKDLFLRVTIKVVEFIKSQPEILKVRAFATITYIGLIAVFTVLYKYTAHIVFPDIDVSSPQVALDIRNKVIMSFGFVRGIPKMMLEIRSIIMREEIE